MVIFWPAAFMATKSGTVIGSVVGHRIVGSGRSAEGSKIKGSGAGDRPRARSARRWSSDTHATRVATNQPRNPQEIVTLGAPGDNGSPGRRSTGGRRRTTRPSNVLQ